MPVKGIKHPSVQQAHDLMSQHFKPGVSRRKKVGKAAMLVHDSGSEDREDSDLQPMEAYQQLLAALKAEAPGGAGDTRPSKRQKTKNAAFKQPLDERGQQKLREAGSKVPGSKKAAFEKTAKETFGVLPGAEKAHSSDTALVVISGSTKSPGRAQAGDRSDDAETTHSNSLSTMRKHLDRQLTEAEILAQSEAKLSKEEARDFLQAWPNGTWLTTGEQLPKAYESLEAAGVRHRLVNLWREACGGSNTGSTDFLSPQQKAFFALARSYKDVLFPVHPYPQSTGAEDQILDAALLHCIDHIVFSSQRIKKANEALRANPDMDMPRDQGFTRPKVLLLLPMRNVAFRVVTRLLELAQKETRADSVQGKARFLEEFGPEEGLEPDAESRAPAEHTALFEGHTDDFFRLGIKITKGAVKLFADFYQSDIIVASPIGLVTKQAQGGDESDDNLDFLSSIEIALLPRCDVLLMQNWAHVLTVFEALNALPKATHGADIMRVYDWCLAGNAKQYRQNILLSSFLAPEMNALFSRLCFSHAGKAKLEPRHKGVLGGSSMQLQQLFDRFSSHSPADDADARFEHFKQRMWPRIKDSGSGGQFIFVPSYFDFVRLRGFFNSESVGFEGLSEYASGSEVARSKRRFTTGKTRIALYTERSHFYHRRPTRGVKDLYFYQLPEHAHFYKELLELAASADGVDAGHATATVLFSELDRLRLQRIVGTSRAKSMLKAATATFLFC